MSGKSGSRLFAAACATVGQLAYEPVRRWSRSMRSPVRSTTHVVAPRGLSMRPMPMARSGRAGSAAAADDRSVEQALEDVERLQELERALLDPCLDVAGGAPGDDGREALVGEARTVLAHVVGEAGGASGRPDGAEPLGVLGADDPDAGEPVLERRVEEQLAPAASRVCAERGQLVARGAHGRGVQSERAAADADRAEQEAVTGELRVQPPRALGERRESSHCRRRSRRRRRRRRCR